ncbi:CdaR family protein [Alkalibacter mobilis]|uniref:CdaR family protein n=1 Tax=Alkalibacter mobilis TaxID=2787712 RepID=UPI00189E9250|nr:CdaR family protein [Alkalibacter mobilis]MBF7096429.1 hypothetical protein [Alkalibacter mobilis]
MKKTKKSNSRTNVKIVISLIIAFVLWVYVIGDQDPKVNQRYNNIRVTINNEEALEEKGLIISQDLDFNVDITLNGRTSTLYNMEWRDITASIDLDPIEDKGTYSLPVRIEGIPELIDLVNVSPANITVDVDRLSEQSRDIKVDFVGELEDGLQLLDYSTNPGSVAVKGGENVLAKINRIATSVDLTGKTKEFTQRVSLAAYDERGTELTDVTISPSEISVTAKIGKNYDVEIIPETTGEPAEGFAIKEITVEPSKITVGSEVASNLTQIKTEPINLNGLDKDAEVEAELIFPDGIESSDGENKVVVKIYVEEIEAREFSVSTFELRNRPEGVNVSEYPEGNNFIVNLSGAKSIIDGLNQSQIQLYIDLAGAVTGESEYDLSMEAIDKINVISIDPEKITLLLEEE